MAPIVGRKGYFITCGIMQSAYLTLWCSTFSASQHFPIAKQRELN
ncbi:MAG: hypothetical protein ACRYG7_00405 [Janthinobacterium lividum]